MTSTTISSSLHSRKGVSEVFESVTGFLPISSYSNLDKEGLRAYLGLQDHRHSSTTLKRTVPGNQETFARVFCLIFIAYAIEYDVENSIVSFVRPFPVRVREVSLRTKGDWRLDAALDSSLLPMISCKISLF